ncbi:MAG: glycosyltransferase family 39 protein [Bryobacteraceae bacterium]
MICVIGIAFVLLVCCSWRNGWRDALLRGFVLFGVAVACSTEILSGAHALARWPVFVFWCLVCGAAGWAAWRRRRAIRFPPLRMGLVDGIAFLGIGCTLALTLVAAIASPPNSADAMAYHMPRVIYWAQQRSAAFFPTDYLNQIILQPLAEYLMLHTYLLAGDRFANLGQWLGSGVSIAGVSLIARNLGASRRGQAVAALFCATLPNGILQASGAKNDYLTAGFLVSFVYFAQRWSKQFAKGDAVNSACALALALLTKATAYLFAPGMVIAVLCSIAHPRLKKLGEFAAMCAAAIFLFNGPQYWRNFSFSGSPLGYDSAQGDGKFRWRNERFGWRETASSLLRNTSEQLGARSERWNRGVYDAVLRAHRRIGINPGDPATTWPGEQFQPPRNANHEADAPNRWQLFLLILSAALLAWRGPRLTPLLYLAGVAFGFVFFCFYLKWQPFLARMFLPLFVMASPVAGLAIESTRSTAIQVVLCLFLLNNARPALFENWVRPLEGPHSVFRVSRREQYFADLGQFHTREETIASAQAADASGCSTIGVDTSQFQVEYPFLAIVRQLNPHAIFIHTGVTNPSAKFYSDRRTGRGGVLSRDRKKAAAAFRCAPVTEEDPRPCAVVCMKCAGLSGKAAEYSGVGPAVKFGDFVVFAKGPRER